MKYEISMDDVRKIVDFKKSQMYTFKSIETVRSEFKNICGVDLLTYPTHGFLGVEFPNDEAFIQFKLTWL
jgi:hypothetical protein